VAFAPRSPLGSPTRFRSVARRYNKVMKFTKMHGLGNDYIYINGLEERVDNPPNLARMISHRQTGVGSDGLILILPSETADLRMEMYNADGSRAQMCGNGIRCVAKYAVEHGLMSPSTGKANEPWKEVRIDTDAGVKPCRCQIVDGLVETVRVDMGQPAFEPAVMPSTIQGDRIVNYPLELNHTEPQASACANLPSSLIVTCVSIGNPHAVVFVEDLNSIVLDVVGPLVTDAPEFPDRINTHFIKIDSAQHVTMKTWERGSGATRACGTGACAVCVAGAITQRTKRKITATLPGGDLELEWADNDHVYMTGPAVEVFSGTWPQYRRP